jgi:hypothetical protein
VSTFSQIRVKSESSFVGQDLNPSPAGVWSEYRCLRSSTVPRVVLFQMLIKTKIKLNNVRRLILNKI